MARLVEIDLPKWTCPVGDWEAQQEANEAYFAEVTKRCREAIAEESLESVPPEDYELVGEILRWSRGDGYALYAVVRTDPLEIVWLPFGDAWEVEVPLIRGLNLDDVREMTGREKRLREVLS